MQPAEQLPPKGLNGVEEIGELVALAVFVQSHLLVRPIRVFEVEALAYDAEAHRKDADTTLLNWRKAIPSGVGVEAIDLEEGREPVLRRDFWGGAEGQGQGGGSRVNENLFA
jgi:hypothetical protein